MKNTNEKGISGFLKFGESYTSLILGIVFVVVATAFILSFVRNKNITAKVTNDAQTISTKTDNNVGDQKNTSINDDKKLTIKTNDAKTNTSMYTVAEGDSLWTIAEKKYKSGYNWVDIAEANNLANPGVLYTGMKLTLPKVQSKLTTTAITSINNNQTVVNQIAGTQESNIKINKITGKSYIISKGDSLWNIAVRAYGDGYQWEKIAKANNLTYPALIHAGNSLSIPRG